MTLGVVLAGLGSGILVAALRMSDVLLGVVRTAFVVSGTRHLAAVFSALEAAVWLAAAGIVFADPSPARALGYVGGVAAGTWVGVTLVHAFKLGTVTVRVFVPVREDEHMTGHLLAATIRERGFGATTFTGAGASGRVDMVLSVVRRRDARVVADIASGFDPRSIVAVDSQAAPGSTLHGVGVVGVRP
jgi:uncharacterized protein YebE (UPF0316 family)